MPIDALSVLCAQLTRDLLAIAKFLFHCTVAQLFCFYQHQTSSRNSDGVTPCGALNTGGV